VVATNPVLQLEGPHLKVVSGPNGQYLLLNLETSDYLKVSRRGYDLLLKSAGQSVGEAMKALVEREGIPVSGLHDFFEKIVRLGFIAGPRPERSATSGCRVQEVWLHVTDRCNLACPMCYFQADKPPACDRNMTAGEMQHALEVISLTRPQQVVISGGEPLVRKDLPDLLRNLREHGLPVWLLTNGTLLSQETCRSIAGHVDRISISLDGMTVAAHERMRGKGTFEAVLRGIRTLQNTGFDRIGIIPTIRRDNLSEVLDLGRFARQLGVSVDSRCLFTARGSAASCRGDFEIGVAELIQRAATEMQRRLRQADMLPESPAGSSPLIDFAQPQMRQCGAGRRKLSIDIDGSLYPCQMLHDRRFFLGNVREFHDLNQLANGPRARRVSRWTVDRIDTVAECRSCDVRHFCGGGCVVSNLAEGIRLDGCPSYCSVMQRSYRAALWEWRSDGDFRQNLTRILERLCPS
jgi:radical SAM protein with 4Fe4S-binding SPASM domain